MSFYRWCLRSGAPILFVIALGQLVFGLAAVFANQGSSVGLTPSGSNDPWGTLLLVQAVLMTVTSAAFPFFGALVIDRLDRRAVDGNRKEFSE
jgi:hypothetical protein